MESVIKSKPRRVAVMEVVITIRMIQSKVVALNHYLVLVNQ